MVQTSKENVLAGLIMLPPFIYLNELTYSTAPESPSIPWIPIPQTSTKHVDDINPLLSTGITTLYFLPQNFVH